MNHRDLSIAIIQYDIIPDKICDNLSHLDQLLLQIKPPVDIILLPEMFVTGFILNPKSIKAYEHEMVLSWMRSVAERYKCTIAGSHPFLIGDKFSNRLFYINYKGEEGFYDKRHLFPMDGENLIYKAGTERVLFQIQDWKILPLICYDLRFPVWSRNAEAYDFLFYSSNWPAARNSTWETLLKARAIENQCYVAGINRIGTDSNGIRYMGKSQIISPLGEVIQSLESIENCVQISLSKRILVEYRNKFPVLDARDDFDIKL
jgi:omega-amidase